MAQRITRQMLENRVAALNSKLGIECDEYGHEIHHAAASGAMIPVVGALSLCGAYGGWRIEVNEHTGGCSDALETGYVNPKQLWAALNAYSKGIDAGQRYAAKETA